MRALRTTILSLSALGLALACSNSDDSASFGGDPRLGGTGGATGSPPVVNGGGNGGLPPEEELEGDFEAPVASGRYLWSANPASNRVALVDAVSLEVRTLEAGYAPTYLAGRPATDSVLGGALVINALSHDATVFALSEGDDDTLAVTATTVPVHEGANAWRVGPRGEFAIAWSNVRAVANPDPTQGFQDVTVLDFRSGEIVTTRLSVGYRPSHVAIDEEGARAFVVSEPGISVIDLGGGSEPSVEKELFLPEQTTTRARDVSLTPDGKLAFVRLEGESDVLIVDTDSDERVSVELPAEVTDLDLSADGTRAIAVMRGGQATSSEMALGGAAGGGSLPGVEPSRIAVLPVDTIVSDPSAVALLEIDELFGSAVVSNDGGTALVFTNATPHDRLTIVDLESLDHRSLDLKAPVRAVYLTGDASHAVALLSPPAGSTKLGAFGLIPVSEPLPPRIEGTAAPTQFVATSVDPLRALVTTRGNGTTGYEAFLARFPELRVDRVSMPSAPIAAGMVPDAGRGFVSQEHPEGRVTFVALEDGVARTLTGFELGSKVVDGP